MTNERFTFLFYQFCFTLNKLYYIKGCCKDCQSCCKKTKKTCTKTILLCLFFFYIVLFQSFLSVTLHVKTSMAVLVLKKKKNSNKNNTNKKNGKSLPGVSKSSRFSFSNTIRRVLASNNFNVFIPVIYFFCLSPNKKACFSIHFSGCYSIDIFCKIHS